MLPFKVIRETFQGKLSRETLETFKAIVTVLTLVSIFWLKWRKA